MRGLAAGGAEVEGLGRAGRFDGEDAGDVTKEPAQLAGRAPSHRVVIFLHGGGWEGACARRVCEAAVLFSEGRGRVVGTMNPELTPGRGLRKAGRPSERLGSSMRSILRSVIAPTSEAAMARKSRTRASGSPWKLPTLSPVRPAARPGCP